MSDDFIPAAKPIIGDDERAAVDAVLATGMLAQGQQVAEFEKEFSEVLRSTAARPWRSTPARPASTSGSWRPASGRATKLSFRRSPLPRPVTPSR